MFRILEQQNWSNGRTTELLVITESISTRDRPQLTTHSLHLKHWKTKPSSSSWHEQQSIYPGELPVCVPYAMAAATEQNIMLHPAAEPGTATCTSSHRICFSPRHWRVPPMLWPLPQHWFVGQVFHTALTAWALVRLWYFSTVHYKIEQL